jgi:hypothetical protein
MMFLTQISPKIDCVCCVCDCVRVAAKGNSEKKAKPVQEIWVRPAISFDISVAEDGT